MIKLTARLNASLSYPVRLFDAIRDFRDTRVASLSPSCLVTIVLTLLGARFFTTTIIPYVPLILVCKLAGFSGQVGKLRVV
jgi:hypothetical protein